MFGSANIRIITFLPRAQAEFNDAYDWYASQSIPAAMGFEEQVISILEKAARAQSLGKWIAGDDYLLVLPHYPYQITYRRYPNQIVVASVFHSSRNPEENPAYRP